MLEIKSEYLLRVTFNSKGNYNHFFGHDPLLDGLISDSMPDGAQLLLTLDLSDPLLGHLSLGPNGLLRLVYPYYYDDGGRFSYRQSPEKIDFVFAESSPGGPLVRNVTDWPYADFPNTFPRQDVTLSLEPMGPVLEGFECADISPYRNPDAHGKSNAIFIGCNQATTQEFNIPCPTCNWDGRLIARFPNFPNGARHAMWGADGVFTLFFVCDWCHVIIAGNECD